MDIYNRLHEYREKGISAIPVKYKAPLIKEWTQYCERLPNAVEVEGWKNLSATGIGVCLGKASRLVAMDIDSKDLELARILQHSPVVKTGAKGETRFFLQDPSIPVQQKITTVKDEKGNAAVEFFLGNKQTVVEGKHSDGLDYKWTTRQTLLTTDIENLPYLDMENVRIAQEYFKQNLPKDYQESDVGGRHSEHLRYACELLNKNITSYDIVGDMMAAHDRELFPYNPYFLDDSDPNNIVKVKGEKDLNKLDSIAKANAISFFLSISKTVNHQRQDRGDVIQLPKTIILPTTNGTWKEITPFEKIVPKFPIEVIPPNMMEWVCTTASNGGASIASIFLQALAGYSSLLGNKAFIEPYENDNYRQAANIWVMMVAPPGSRKSQITNLALKPIIKISKKIKQDEREIQKKNKKIKANNEEEIKDLNKKLKLAKLNIGTEKEIAHMELRISQLENENEMMDRKAYDPIAQNITPEALLLKMENNLTGLLQIYDEGGSLFAQYSKKGYEALRGHHLSGWNGVDTYSYETKHNGQNYLEGFNISMIVNIQPAIFNKHISDTMEDGYAQRSLILFEEVKNLKDTDIILGNGVENAINNIFWQAYNLPQGNTLKLTSDARDFYKEYYKPKISSYASHPLTTFISKFAGLVLRLALGLESMGSTSVPKTVSLKSLQDAEKILEFNLDNLYLAHGDNTQTHIKLIIDNIKSRSIISGATVTDVIRLGIFPERHIRAGYVQELLEKMESMNYIKLEKSSKEIRIFINPVL